MRTNPNNPYDRTEDEIAADGLERYLNVANVMQHKGWPYAIHPWIEQAIIALRRDPIVREGPPMADQILDELGFGNAVDASASMPAVAGVMSVLDHILNAAIDRLTRAEIEAATESHDAVGELLDSSRSVSLHSHKKAGGGFWMIRNEDMEALRKAIANVSGGA